MRLTVLGSSPACQNPGGACSGYLIEQDGVTILIDCGSGVFSRLQQYVEPDRVDAVIISHMHADHTLDLIQYRYYLFFAGLAGTLRRQPLLYLPPEGHDRLLRISRGQDRSAAFYLGSFAVQEYDVRRRLTVGPLSIGFVPVLHVPHTYAVRVEGAATLAFSADSGPCAGLAEVARDSDLFLCECANHEGSDYPFHLTPRQAGQTAQEAGARQLLLTHRWWLHGLDQAVVEARERYAGPVSLAREGMQVALLPRA